MSAKFKVLVLDGVAARGVEVLAKVPEFEVLQSKSLSEDELLARIGDIDGLVVRSQTKVTAKAIAAAGKLKVVGRAGVGVDNVDVSAATKKGIVVMNTPGGNTISTAEHAFSLMLSVARQIPQAHATMKAGKWDRKKFEGVEVFGKTLGIIGMGRIGTEFARRAQAFGMKVLAFDPYLSAAKAQSLQVELYEKLTDLLPRCDFITLHIPLTPETKGILSEKNLALCKRGVRIVNCARGGLVNEHDLQKALQSGQVAGAALDVYEQEPPPPDYALRDEANLVMTPHLGASTAEAQENVGIEVAAAVRELLLHGTIMNAVNVPSVDAKTLEQQRPYIELAGQLGRALAQLAPSRCDSLTVNFTGKIAAFDTTAIRRAALRGFLVEAVGPEINEVNATHYAQDRGLKYGETKVDEAGEYSEQISVTVSAGGQEYEVSGTILGNSTRIVSVNQQSLEARPEGVLFVMENTDRPGIVGYVGTILGKHKVNIAGMSLSRAATGSKALSVLNLDSMPGDAAIAEIQKDTNITSIKLIQL
ncbi:MAG: phosphoglycerate dehydrogenase [Verrucomicrobiales bacterium]|jgi:D-3-phosphoglycerate dehydrogenase|nr:phosphoglycerate dehydrogenase [Verrucomicrobiales bacterium]